MSDETTETTPEPLRTLHADILAQRARIMRLPNPTAAMLTAEMASTVLSIVGDVVVAVTQVRDGLEQGMDDAFSSLDERLTAVENEESSLTAEDADKLQALVETCKHLVGVIRAAGQQTPEVERALGMADALATECGEIVEGARMLDDEDDDDDKDEPAAAQLGNGTA